MAEGQTELPKPKNNVLDLEAARQKRRQEQEKYGVEKFPTRRQLMAPPTLEHSARRLETQKIRQIKEALTGKDAGTGELPTKPKNNVLDLEAARQKRQSEAALDAALAEEMRRYQAEKERERLQGLTEGQWKEWERLERAEWLTDEEWKRKKELANRQVDYWKKQAATVNHEDSEIAEWRREGALRTAELWRWDGLTDDEQANERAAKRAAKDETPEQKEWARLMWKKLLQWRADPYFRNRRQFDSLPPHEQEALLNRWEYYILGQQKEDKDKPLGEIIGEKIVAALDYIFAAIGKAFKSRRAPTTDKPGELVKTGQQTKKDTRHADLPPMSHGV